MGFEGHKRYFDQRANDLHFFFARFPEQIDFRGKRVVDFGCGHGALTFAAAERGAAEVLGIDVNQELIDFAKENQQRQASGAYDIVDFQCADLLKMDLSDYDLILSEATFEHVIGLESYLAGMRDILKPGGRIYTGYSPLYNSPWGDHGRLKAPLTRFLPWMHLVFPKRWLFLRLGTPHGTPCTSLEELGLNGMSFAAHRDALHNCGMRVVFFEANNQKRLLMRLVEPFRMMPPIRELLTFSIYAILENDANSPVATSI